MGNNEPLKNPPETARNLASRLMAVQAVYQAGQSGQSLKSAAAEYLEHRVEMPLSEEDETEKMIRPDGALLKNIVEGVEERGEDLAPMITANIRRDNKEMEPLLKAILLCGAYELLAHHEIDAPIIINDYLNVAHGFYGPGEVSLVNGILDNISKGLRDS